MRIETIREANDAVLAAMKRYPGRIGRYCFVQPGKGGGGAGRNRTISRGGHDRGEALQSVQTRRSRSVPGGGEVHSAAGEVILSVELTAGEREDGCWRNLLGLLERRRA